MMERNQQFEELKLSVPWGHIAAKVWGLSTDRRILAVHGILDNAGTFNRIIKFLPKDCYIVCIDLPGHGFSSHFDLGVPLNYFSYVLTIHHVLNALQWNTCIYMGHSFGSHIGTMFSILYPKRIEKLILLDSLMPMPTLHEDLISSLQEVCDIAIKADENKIPRLYTKEEVLYALKYTRFSALNAEAAEALFERGLTQINDLYKYNRDIRLKRFVVPFFDIDQLLTCIKKISTPCLIILSSSSLDMYKWQTYILNQLRNYNNTSNIIYVNGNHDVHNNYPERVAPHICKFLGSNNKSKL
ncbi:PREDICTED: serine hydrolase-like protein [Polistes canadensis]|uniref:serine hydrolase-like protein n=1 Tax=Polistes canadensis TaxID=91411 RepID=UPI0007190702|nr:PREDICTED: serine hydrolase-like protein [Polistes canadensis]XP_014610189.1 PREDICTED: serine hydrolase-like protein [Polistes canadensis]XP_014610190.1 PREDICTED: serine hydrolase-like protein [Polistes canadensis]XP_014610191.1 PREDICTED: serine hydrolase-like protein [Polistes canadensis]XP_014610192.1 PREDICTED: serine hydrolase-like protein [Polistes canadensis]XP_014610193.1 PREDICTED: serine hydrolase-like protein [Polistes canadensis]XP_014610194.1 PREDICTED: serine hydrolase-like